MIDLRPGGRVVRRGPGFAGTLGAILALCLSLTPSLLPRHWLLQGLLSGITMAIGYGAGASLGALVRAVRPGLAGIPGRAWQVLAGGGGALAVAFLGLGWAWDGEVRRLVGAEAAPLWYPVAALAAGAALLALLVLAARAIRLATRRLTDTLGRFSPRPVAAVTAVGLVAALSYGIGPAMAFPGFVDLADRAAQQANGDTPSGVTRPSSPFVSGGPASLVPWETLGAYGREFASGAVPPVDLAAFAAAGRDAGASGAGDGVVPPVRVYVGRDSAPTPREQAALAVRELERTGGLDRAVVGVIVTTGTGWVNPAVPATLEFLRGGDTALIAMQYSYLPSWISFVADRSSASEAAATLIGAVRDRLDEVPASDRPEFVVYGESLGSHGIENAFGDLSGLLAATDGALLVGPPHSNPLWRQLTGDREVGSPIWRPATTRPVCFGQGGSDLESAAEDGPGLVYLQNATDPVVWWSPELLYRRPAWLDGERGPDVSGAMRWFPVVTFWQVTVDLIRSTKAPPGHGHAYRESIADAWVALAAPAGWTGLDTTHLRASLSQWLSGSA